MPEASASDVRVEIDTGLSDGDIEGSSGDGGILARIEREWKRQYDSSDFEDTQHIQDFEAALAALRIAEGRDRRASDSSVGDSSISYEADEISQLRKRVRRADPGNEFGHPGSVHRDSDRYVTSGTPGSDT